MQLVDSKLHSANVAAFDARPLGVIAERSYDAIEQQFSLHSIARGRARAERPNFVSWLKASSASQRVLWLFVAASFAMASPALFATVQSAVSLSFQILLQAGHAGLIALQIFGR